MKHPFDDLNKDDLWEFLGIVEQFIGSDHDWERAHNDHTIFPGQWAFLKRDSEEEDGIVMVTDIKPGNLTFVMRYASDWVEVWGSLDEIVPMPLCYYWQSTKLGRLHELSLTPPLPGVTRQWKAKYLIKMETRGKMEDFIAFKEHSNPHLAAARAYEDLMSR